MWTYNYTNELYHHGIIGMKWGVRKYQNTDGSLTAEGKKRYKLSKNALKNKEDKSGYRLLLEKKYIGKGLSKDEAIRAADRNIRAKKIVAAAAGVTVAACAAYYARNKYLANNVDQVLKSGTVFHNLDSEPTFRSGEHLYVTYRDKDINFFRSHFAPGKKSHGGEVFDNVLKANKDVKIPSLKTRKAVFKDLYDNDPNFRSVFDSHSQMGKAGSSDKAYKLMWRRFGDRKDAVFSEQRKKYFDALQKKGYAAIVDELDTKSTVFRAKAPLILLNTSNESLSGITSTKLTDADLLTAKYMSSGRDSAISFLNSNGVPHVNTFKDVKIRKSVSNKEAKARDYVNKVLEYYDANPELRTIERNRMVLGNTGKEAYKTGKYMSKGLSYKAANLKVYKQHRAKEIAKDVYDIDKGTVALGVGSLGLGYSAKQAYAMDYLKKHPNTRKTYSQLMTEY